MISKKEGRIYKELQSYNSWGEKGEIMHRGGGEKNARKAKSCRRKMAGFRKKMSQELVAARPD